MEFTTVRIFKHITFSQYFAFSMMAFDSPAHEYQIKPFELRYEHLLGGVPASHPIVVSLPWFSNIRKA